MGLPDIREIAHAHCRFKLRSGREVFGVVWEVVTAGERALFFTTIGEYERSRKEPQLSIDMVPLLAEDILQAERLCI